MTGSGRKNNKCYLNFSLNLGYKLQPINSKQIKNKLRMEAVNYVCFKLEEKATTNDKKSKNNFISIIGEKFVISIR